jgi:hypothetical protein
MYKSVRCRYVDYLSARWVHQITYDEELERIWKEVAVENKHLTVVDISTDMSSETAPSRTNVKHVRAWPTLLTLLLLVVSYFI